MLITVTGVLFILVATLKNINILQFLIFYLKRGIANVPAFLQFSHFTTRIVHFEKVNFLFF